MRSSQNLPQLYASPTKMQLRGLCWAPVKFKKITNLLESRVWRISYFHLKSAAQRIGSFYAHMGLCWERNNRRIFGPRKTLVLLFSSLIARWLDTMAQELAKCIHSFFAATMFRSTKLSSIRIVLLSLWQGDVTLNCVSRPNCVCRATLNSDTASLNAKSWYTRH